MSFERLRIRPETLEEKNDSACVSAELAQLTDIDRALFEAALNQRGYDMTMMQAILKNPLDFGTTETEFSRQISDFLREVRMLRENTKSTEDTEDTSAQQQIFAKLAAYLHTLVQS